MSREFILNMTSEIMNESLIDEWGCAQLTDEKKEIGCEYNYCIDGEGRNCSGIYFMFADKDTGLWRTEYNTCESYHIEWGYDWQGKLEKAMNEFLDQYDETDAIAELFTAMNKFSAAGFELSMAIEHANAEELIASGYPFNLDFDGMCIKISEWKHTVMSEMNKKGSEDNKTEEKPKIDTSIVDAHCDKDFYEIYMDSNGNKRIRDVDVIWYAGDDIEEKPYRYGTTHYDGLLMDFVELEDYNDTLSQLEQWGEDWSEEEAVYNVTEMLKNRKYLPLSKVNAYTECGSYWG